MKSCAILYNLVLCFMSSYILGGESFTVVGLSAQEAARLKAAKIMKQEEKKRFIQRLYFLNSNLKNNYAWLDVLNNIKDLQVRGIFDDVVFQVFEGEKALFDYFSTFPEIIKILMSNVENFETFFKWKNDCQWTILHNFVNILRLSSDAELREKYIYLIMMLQKHDPIKFQNLIFEKNKEGLSALEMLRKDPFFFEILKYINFNDIPLEILYQVLNTLFRENFKKKLPNWSFDALLSRITRESSAELLTTALAKFMHDKSIIWSLNNCDWFRYFLLIYPDSEMLIEKLGGVVKVFNLLDNKVKQNSYSSEWKKLYHDYQKRYFNNVTPKEENLERKQKREDGDEGEKRLKVDPYYQAV